MTVVQRRLAKLERLLAAHRPPRPPDAPLAWIGWLRCAELGEAERLAEEAAEELSEDARLRLIDIEARALGRVAAGWPQWTDDPKRYGE